jgi:ABC-type branched-subunit amino acid transport system substrate-binding protein
MTKFGMDLVFKDVNEKGGVVTWLVKQKGFKRIGVLYQDDKYGYTFRDPAKKVLKKMGLKLAGAESTRRGLFCQSGEGHR